MSLIEFYNLLFPKIKYPKYSFWPLTLPLAMWYYPTSKTCPRIKSGFLGFSPVSDTKKASSTSSIMGPWPDPSSPWSPAKPPPVCRRCRRHPGTCWRWLGSISPPTPWACPGTPPTPPTGYSCCGRSSPMRSWPPPSSSPPHLSKASATSFIYWRTRWGRPWSKRGRGRTL